MRGHIKMTLSLRSNATWKRLTQGVAAKDVQAAVELAVELTAKEWLDLAKSVTPEGEGKVHLSDHWHMSVFPAGAGVVIAKIYNDLKYAQFVEYGTKPYTIFAKQRPEGPLVIRPKNGKLLVWSDGGYSFAYPAVIQDYKPLVWASPFGGALYAAKVEIPARPPQSMIRSTKPQATALFRANLRMVFRELLGRR